MICIQRKPQYLRIYQDLLFPPESIWRFSWILDWLWFVLCNQKVCKEMFYQYYISYQTVLWIHYVVLQVGQMCIWLGDHQTTLWRYFSGLVSYPLPLNHPSWRGRGIVPTSHGMNPLPQQQNQEHRIYLR